MLSRLFRRLFLEALQKAFEQGNLQFFSDFEHLHDAQSFAQYLKPLQDSDWVVYAKPPFAGPEAVLAYLARYTHRVAIGNERLQSIENDQVTFQAKDYRHHNRSKNLTVEAHEFIRRFLLHALPPGFQRIRHYGFPANAHRREKLALCRKLLSADLSGLLPTIAVAVALAVTAQVLEKRDESAYRCPVCGVGVMIAIQLLPPVRGIDSS